MPRFVQQAAIQETGAPNSENKPESSGIVYKGFQWLGLRRALTFSYLGLELGLASGTAAGIQACPTMLKQKGLTELRASGVRNRLCNQVNESAYGRSESDPVKFEI